MKLTYTHETDFRRERDFGAKINATFEFLAAQFKPLFKCLLYFVLPGALLAGIGIGLFFSKLSTFALKPAQSPNANAVPSLGDVTGILVGGLGFLIAFILVMSTLYVYVRVRMNLPAAEVVQPAQVWAHLWPRLGRLLGAVLLLGGLSGAVYALMLGAIVLAFGNSLTGGVDNVGAIFSIMGLMFLAFIPLVWVSIVLTQYFPAFWLEDAGVWGSLRRSFALVRGKWWSTFGLVMIVSMIQSFFAYLFAIPLYATILINALKVPGFDSPVISVVGASIYSVGAVFSYTILLVAVMFQYFNLVERREGRGMSQLISSLGQTPAPVVSNEHFRPDEEGEY